MKTIHSLNALLGLVSLAHAQSSTTSLFILGADSQPLDASVVSADASSTVFKLNCRPGTDPSDCGIEGYTVTVGKGFYAAQASVQDLTASWSCSFTGSYSAICSESQSVQGDSSTRSIKVAVASKDITYLPVSITAGLDKLLGAAARPGSASATTTSTSTSSSSTSSSTRVPIIFPGVHPSDLALSVVTAAPSSTIYKLGCAQGVDCPFPPAYQPWVTMAGLSSLGSNYTSDSERFTLKCDITSTSTAKCVQTIVGSGLLIDNGSTGTVTKTLNYPVTYGSATVTAGQEKLATSTSTSGGNGGSSSSTTTTKSKGAAAPGATAPAGGLMAAAVAGIAGAAALLV